MIDVRDERVGILGVFLFFFHFDGSLIVVLIAFIYFVGGCVAFYGGIRDSLGILDLDLNDVR